LRNLANEITPDLRRTYNTILYAVRTLINIENPSNKYLAKNIKEAEEYQIDLQHIIVKRKFLNFLPLKIYLVVNLEISEFKKENTSLIMFKNIFQNTLQKYHNYKHIYTDASKIDHNVGIAVVTKNSTTSYKLSP